MKDPKAPNQDSDQVPPVDEAQLDQITDSMLDEVSGGGTYGGTGNDGA